MYYLSFSSTHLDLSRNLFVFYKRQSCKSKKLSFSVVLKKILKNCADILERYFRYICYYVLYKH